MIRKETIIMRQKVKEYKDHKIRLNNIINRNDEVLKRDYANEWVNE